MADIKENAYRIAKAMYDNNFIGANMVVVADLKNLVGVSPEDFDFADNYLLETRYCEGTMGGDTGQRVLKASGIAFVKANLMRQDNTSNSAGQHFNSSTVLELSSHSYETPPFQAGNDNKPNIEQANKLYSYVLAMSTDWHAVDDVKAQLIIEYSKDAIDSFSKTNQEKKVELRKLIEKAENVISPDSIDSLKKRAEKAFLRVMYPKNPTLRNALFAVLLIIMSLSMVIPTLLKTESPKEETKETVQPGRIDPPKNIEIPVEKPLEIIPEAQVKLAELYSLNALDEIIKSSDTLIPDAGFRLRADVFIMRGELEKALSEYNLQPLRAKGYPSNIDNGYYTGWNSLSLLNNTLFIRDQKEEALAKYLLIETLKAEPGSIWSLKEMELIRGVIGSYEVKHPYCCLRKFLIDGYTPNDIFRLIQIDLLLGKYKQANSRLNLLRLIDWEADFTEIETLSVTACLLQRDYEAARTFVYTNAVGFNALRYSNAINKFIEMAVNYNTNQFDKLKNDFEQAIQSTTIEFPYNVHDSYFEQPVLEKWLSGLGNSDRAQSLINSWRHLKAIHGMADLYTYLYQKRREPGKH